jgi:arylsulfatase A-like enzyme
VGCQHTISGSENSLREAQTEIQRANFSGLLSLAYLANILSGFQPDSAVHRAALVAGLILFAAAVVNLWLPGRWPALGALLTPWISVTVLLGTPLLALAPRPRNVALMAVGLAFVWMVTTRVLGTAGATAQWRQALSVAIAIPAVLAATAAAVKEAPSLGTVANSATASSGPNVLLIVWDTVRADHLSLYGYGRRTTPWLEEFAREATVYERATAASNFTLPTHASIFTGKYPRNHGAICFPPGKSVGVPLARRHRTMAEILSSQGYLSMAVVANAGYVRKDFGLDQGFAVFDSRWPLECVPDGDDHADQYLRRRVRQLLDRWGWATRYDQRTRRGDEITDEGLKLIEEAQRRQRPFFLFLNYMDAHMPRIPPPPFNRLFSAHPPVASKQYSQLIARVVGSGQPLTPSEREALTAQYDRALAYLDSELRRLVDRLKQLGAYDQTLLILTADHGEALGEDNWLDHPRSLEEHQVWIPLLVRYPDRRDGGRVKRRVSQVDLLPTVLDALGIPAPEALDGRSLRAPETEKVSVVFSEAYLDIGTRELRPDYPDRELAVLAENLKLISRSNGEIRLHDLAADPAEDHNLYHPAHPRAAELLAELNRWLERNPLRVELQAPPDPKTLDRLRALGYVK